MDQGMNRSAGNLLALLISLSHSWPVTTHYMNLESRVFTGKFQMVNSTSHTESDHTRFQDWLAAVCAEGTMLSLLDSGRFRGLVLSFRVVPRIIRELL